MPSEISSDAVYIREGALKASSYFQKRQIIENDGYTYIGLAEPGSATSQNVWFICRIDSTGNQLHADGNDKFDNVFDNYSTISYS